MSTVNSLSWRFGCHLPKTELGFMNWTIPENVLFSPNQSTSWHLMLTYPALFLNETGFRRKKYSNWQQWFIARQLFSAPIFSLFLLKIRVIQSITDLNHGCHCVQLFTWLFGSIFRSMPEHPLQAYNHLFHTSTYCLLED